MINKTTLSNGIRVITEHIPQTYSATVMIWVNSGSYDEPDQINGISHIIEHMIFKGTSNRTAKDIVQSIENTGGSINAFTDKEVTCYYAQVLSDQVPVTIDILLDMLFNSNYREEDLELEKQVITEEIKMYEDTPDEFVYDVLLKSYWNNHPLGNPVTGTVENVLKITRNDIIDFIEKFYTPDNIIISIAGNFDEDQIVAQINNSVKHINKTSPLRKLYTPEITPNVSIINKDIEQSHICLGTKGISVLDKDRYTLAIIDVCLGGCMASRLFQEIRENRGLVYSINTYEALFRPSGIFGVYAGTNPSNVQEVIRLIMAEIEKLKLYGLTYEEIQKAKSHLKGGLLIGLESTKYRASKNGKSELYFNKIFNTEEICQSIDNVTPDDINRLSNKIFDPKYMGISLVGPNQNIPAELSLSC